MMSMNLIDIAILNIKGANYRCIINGISKSEAINLIQNIDLTEKTEHFLSHVKMGKETLTFDDTEIEKNKFYRYKSPVHLRDVDIEEVLVSNKTSSGEKNYK